MTKFILNGGNLGGSAKKGKAFFDALLADFTQSKVLFCYFSQPRENWEKKFLVHSLRTQSYNPGQKLQIQLAMPDTFVAQMKWADAVMFWGGDDALLMHYAKKIDGFTAALAGKNVGGSSAGTSLWAPLHYTCDWRQVKAGLGVLQDFYPIVHYGSNFGADDPRGPIDWQEAKSQLQKIAGSDKIITPIAEGDFVEYTL